MGNEMLLKFTKMQGAGNDFVMINGISQNVAATKELIRHLSDRHYGIGADQVLIVEKTQLPEVDFRYRIFNADGHEVEQCGNGARCFARFVFDQGLTNKRRIRVETQKSIIEPEILENGQIRVMMGCPSINPSDLPLLTRGLVCQMNRQLPIYQYEGVTFAPVSMGNPSAVVFVDDVEAFNVLEVGQKLCFAPCFPKQTNVVFMEICDRHKAKVRVFERGAGETLACGSGTCSGVVAAMLARKVSEFVEVQAHGGLLSIQWDGQMSSPVYLVGDAVKVFDGEIMI